MYPTVACDHDGGVEAKGGSGAVRDLSSGFGNDQGSGGGVPGGEVELPESVENSHGHMAEVEGGRPRPPDPLGPPGESFEVIEVPEDRTIGLSIGKSRA